MRLQKYYLSENRLLHFNSLTIIKDFLKISLISRIITLCKKNIALGKKNTTNNSLLKDNH